MINEKVVYRAYWNDAGWCNDNNDVVGRSVLVDLPLSEISRWTDELFIVIPQSIKSGEANFDELASFMDNSDLDCLELYVTYDGSEAQVYFQELTFEPMFNVH